MYFSLLHPSLVEKLAVVDISPSHKPLKEIAKYIDIMLKYDRLHCNCIITPKDRSLSS